MNLNFPGNNFAAADPSKKRLIVRIPFPDSYKKAHPDWKNELGCCQFIQTIIFVLYSLGLGCLTADAEDDFKEGCFTFWVDPNETVYARLPVPIERGLGEHEAMPNNMKRD